MREAYGAIYSRLYSEHWWWRSRELLVLTELDRIVGADRDAALLDVGCGDGLLLEQLSRHGEVEGIELDERLVSETTRSRWNVYLGALEDYEPQRSFDVITALDVVEHIEDDLGAVRRLGELLRSDGSLLLTVPALQSLWTHHDEWNQHYRRYSKRHLAAVVADAGLTVVRTYYCFGWMVLPKLLVRLRESLLGPSGDLPKIPPGPLNRSLEILSRLDHRVARRGWWPCGSSLLLVATKTDSGRERVGQRHSTSIGPTGSR